MEEISARIRAKAEQLVQDKKVKKEIETNKRIHFSVVGTEETHSVIFDKGKNKWSCDCSYNSLKNKTCSHIVASQNILKS
jgi:hypothetical protein